MFSNNFQYGRPTTVSTTSNAYLKGYDQESEEEAVKRKYQIRR